MGGSATTSSADLCPESAGRRRRSRPSGPTTATPASRGHRYVRAVRTCPTTASPRARRSGTATSRKSCPRASRRPTSPGPTTRSRRRRTTSALCLIRGGLQKYNGGADDAVLVGQCPTTPSPRPPEGPRRRRRRASTSPSPRPGNAPPDAIVINHNVVTRVPSSTARRPAVYLVRTS